MADKLKFVIAVLLLVAGVAGFYLLGEYATIYRVLSVLAGVVACALVGGTTEPGRHFIEFAREAVAETKKVVWPSKKETVQTTGAVFAFVLVMAVFLFIVDKGLEWLFYGVILGWKS
jgi:preprotein translocase subunit SecE